DDETIRAVVRRLAEIAGADVTEAESGEDALRALYDARPDVVVLDIDLPGIDGWNVLERMRQLTDLPVVMLSAHADELEKVRALQAGADDYVTKPFGPQELLARLQAHVRRATARSGGGGRGGASRLPPHGGGTACRGRLTHDRDAALTVDSLHAEASVGDRPLTVTPREFRLLAAFV